jgi:hypothetical protein
MTGRMASGKRIAYATARPTTSGPSWVWIVRTLARSAELPIATIADQFGISRSTVYLYLDASG